MADQIFNNIGSTIWNFIFFFLNSNKALLNVIPIGQVLWKSSKKFTK